MVASYKKYGRRLFRYFMPEVDGSAVEIKQVQTKRELRRFVEFEIELYRGNRYYVPPLIDGELETLQPATNPAFEFLRSGYFLAYKGRRIVGRIAVIINHKANDIWNHNQGRFGWFDFEDDLAISQKAPTYGEWKPKCGGAMLCTAL